MRRRAFIAGLGGAIAWPLTAGAQTAEQVRRIGLLNVFADTDSDARDSIRAMVQALQQLGWSEGRNLRIDYRWNSDKRDRARTLAQELIDTRPDLIVTCGGLASVAMSQTTKSIPIIFVQVVDPIALSLVPNLAHPGGNVTGFSNFEASVAGKWLETLKQAVPSVVQVGAIFEPDNPASVVYLHDIESVAPAFHVRVEPLGVRNAIEIERGITEFARLPNAGLIIIPNPTTQGHRDSTIKVIAQHKLPAIYPYRLYAVSGGLMSYGVDLPDVYRRSADYIDRVLKGAKPGDLPVQQPTKFELIINLKTAKMLEIDIPAAMISRADEVIE
jgi:putative tryptophan/tyrosine transport system substrate-binding protein